MKSKTQSPKQQKYYLEPHQSDLSIISTPLKTKYGIIRPIKVKEYPNLVVDIEILKMQDWEVKNWIKKSVKDSIIEETVNNDLDINTTLQCIQNNLAGLRDKYNDMFCKFVIGFDDKFIHQFTTQEEFDEFRKQILTYNRINWIEWNPNPILRKYQKMDLFAKKTLSGGGVDFDAIYTSLMCVGHSPHNINDYSLAQFYGAFSRLQLFKQYDTTTLFKTVDTSGKTEITEWFKSTLDVSKREDKDWSEIEKENSNYIK